MNNTILQTEQLLKPQSVVERRKAPRFDASAIPDFKSISQVGGPEVKLINISRCGALIESPEVMPLGSSISLQITTSQYVHIVRGRIIGRSIHYRISPQNEKVLHCQSAISFDEDFPILPKGPNSD